MTTLAPIPQPRQYPQPVVKPLPDCNFVNVYLCVRGVKVRCRKPDFHMMRVKRYPIDSLDKKEAHTLAFDVFRKNIKFASEAWLSFQPVKVDDHCESHAMMSDTKEALQLL